LTADLEHARAALAKAGTLAQVQQVLRGAARALAGAQGATVVFLDDGDCFYADEDAISPLWKGQRFPVANCVSGWAMINGAQAAITDISVDDRIPQDAYRPTFVRSLVMTPIRPAAPLGAIGVYWADLHVATARECERMTALADAAAEALHRCPADSHFVARLSASAPAAGG
jgi:hypothetical protein